MCRDIATTAIQLCLVLLMLLPARLAWAESTRFELTAPIGECPPAAHLNERVLRLIGTSAEESGSARVTITRAETQYSVVIAIRTVDGAGERRFTSTSCQLAVDTAALIIVISLFPDRAAEFTERAQALQKEQASPAHNATQTAPSADKPAQSSPTSAPAKPSFQSSSESPEKAALEWALSLNLGLDAFALPSPAPEAGVVLTLRTPSFLVLEAGVNATLPVEEQGSAGSARLWLWGGNVHACYALLHERWLIAPCAGMAGYRIEGEGSGVETARAGSAFYGGFALGVLANLRLNSRLRLRLYAEGMLALWRQGFAIAGNRVHLPGTIDVSGFFGPELTF